MLLSQNMQEHSFLQFIPRLFYHSTTERGDYEMCWFCVYTVFTHWHGLNRTNNPEECQILVPWSIKAKHATKMSIATSDLRYSLLWYKLHLVRLYVVFNETKNINLENSYFRIRTYKGKHTQNHSTPLCSFRC